MTAGNTVMMFGVGDLGGWVLEFLARREGVSRIIACDKREEWGWCKTESAAISAGIEGYDKNIKFEKCDVVDVDATAELIQKYNPDFIYMCMTLMSYTVAEFFPPEVKKDIQSISSTMIPMHTTLPLYVMKAVNKVGSKAICLNHAWPDLSNPMLWRGGYKVHMGAGNVDNVVNEVRRKLSVLENIPYSDVKVYIIYEHIANVWGTRSGIPFYFKAMIGDKDITNKYDAHSLISDREIRSKKDWLSWLIQNKTAAGAVRNIMAVLNDTNEFVHACGINGLIGGYPIRINAQGATIELPDGMSLEEAIKINEDGMKYEGCKEIKDDGTLVNTDEAVERTKKYLGFECKEIKVEDSHEWAKLIIASFKKIAAKHNVNIPVY